MNDVMTSALVLGAELGAIALVIFVIALIFYWRRKKNDKGYVSDFVSTYKEDMEAQRKGMREALAAKCFLEGKDASEFIERMDDVEKKLYKNILNMYMGHDRSNLEDIRGDVAGINEEWLKATQKSISNAMENSVDDAEIQALTTEIDDLKAENARMAAELEEAMQTMEDIVKEYSLMYAGQENEKMDQLSGEYNRLKEKADSHGDKEDK